MQLQLVYIFLKTRFWEIQTELKSHRQDVKTEIKNSKNFRITHTYKIGDLRLLSVVSIQLIKFFSLFNFYKNVPIFSVVFYLIFFTKTSDFLLYIAYNKRPVSYLKDYKVSKLKILFYSPWGHK